MNLTSDALARFRDAERRLLAGEIPRNEFDAVAGSVVAVLAGAAERESRLREAIEGFVDWYSSPWDEDDEERDFFSQMDRQIKLSRAALESKGGE